MCITVGGAKRNLRIRILQGRRPFAERSQCRGERFFAPTTYAKVSEHRRNHPPTKFPIG
ncbi:MAG: hypothetical protein LBU34_13790 [Planctomycetaceae bacterium]|nr:hypothetical protein [Planctomycetaceae bacterium]